MEWDAPSSLSVFCASKEVFITKINFNPFKDEAQTALFKDPVRTAL
jgi:hypothetical protein